MAAGFADDPHSQDGTVCPRNFRGLRSYRDLQDWERRYVPARALALENKPLPGNFDTSHLRKMHWYLFRDVFPWAGELRVVDIAKPGGTSFAHYRSIESSLADLLAELARERFLRDMQSAAFAERTAYYLGELNAIHPFREGNGRTQREFVRTLAVQAGHPLHWGALDAAANVASSIKAQAKKDYSGLTAIVQEAMQYGEQRGSA